VFLLHQQKNNNHVNNIFQRKKGKLHPATSAIIKPRFFDLELLSFGEIQKITHRPKGQCHFELPITGGILALNRGKGKGQNSQGSLQFSNSIQKEDRRGSASGKRGSENKKSDESKMFCQFQSQIGSNYCPGLAGLALPISKFRKRCYLSTQSLIHAYVMHRFHCTWNDRVRKVC